MRRKPTVGTREKQKVTSFPPNKNEIKLKQIADFKIISNIGSNRRNSGIGNYL